MELNKSTIKKILGIITFAVLLYAGLQNWNQVGAFAGRLFGYVFPFLLGACVAFILNVPMRFIETRVLEPLIRNKNGRLYKARRMLSLIITLVLVAGVLFLVVFLVVPALGDTFRTVANQMPYALADLRRWAYSIMDQYPDVAQKILSIEIDWEEIGSRVGEWLRTSGGNVLTSTIGVATSVVGSLFNFFLAVIFSFYVLLQKEKLGCQCKQILYAFLPEKVAARTLYVCTMAGETFSRFLSGQCLEAFILGAMFFVAMTVFRFKYALMISILIAVTALIPIFGAFIGFFVGTFLLLIDNAARAFWFVILFFVLQQLEGNLIYPHVVGNSVGLPSIWVLVAVTVGGSAMGISGMLIFIPLCSVLYALTREEVYGRLKSRYGDRYKQLTAMRPGQSPKHRAKPKKAPPPPPTKP